MSFWSPRFFLEGLSNNSLRIGSPASGVCSKYLGPRIFRRGFPCGISPCEKKLTKGWTRGTLQGTNICHLGKRKFIFKCALGWDMLIPRRVIRDWETILIFMLHRGFVRGYTSRIITHCGKWIWIPQKDGVFNFFGAGLGCSKPFGFKKCFERITKGVYMYVCVWALV